MITDTALLVNELLEEHRRFEKRYERYQDQQHYVDQGNREDPKITERTIRQVNESAFKIQRLTKQLVGIAVPPEH